MNAEFAEALGCKEKAIHNRLYFLGHHAVCGRCGGGDSAATGRRVVGDGVPVVDQRFGAWRATCD